MHVLFAFPYFGVSLCVGWNLNWHLQGCLLYHCSSPLDSTWTSRCLHYFETIEQDTPAF